MANVTITGLAAVLAANLDDTAVVEVDDKNGNTRKATIAQLRTQLQTPARALDLLFVDATYDIGKSGATRPRDLFLSRNAVIGGTLAVTGQITPTGGVLFGHDRKLAISGDDVAVGTGSNGNLFTPAAGTSQVYLVSVASVTTGQDQSAYAWILSDGSGTLRIKSLQATAGTVITSSAGNVVVNNTSGSTQTYRWSAVRIS